jgi:16S rRNA (guanine527-N7)-methyltransferase
MADFDHAGLTHSLKQGLENLQTDAKISLQESQIKKLIDYVALLTKWNAVYNLTAVRDPAQMIHQHILDSLAACFAFNGAHNVLDVGAGGGLPGIVLAITRPDMQISMIDIVQKKTAFLTQAKTELALNNVTVHTARVEQLEVPHKFDVITSRAFAELCDFVNWSAHLLAEGGSFIAMKGVLPREEIARLPKGWQVTEIKPLQVPALNAERHLIFIKSEH